MPGGRRFLLACAVLVAAVLLTLAFHLPFLRLSTLQLLGHGGQEHSLISAVHTLLRTNQALLGGVLLAFAIFLPLLKLLYLLLLTVLPGREVARAEAPLRALAWLGCWSVQDVVALMAAAAVVVSDAALRQRTAGGAYCFVAAVLAMLLAYTWLRADTSALRSPLPAARAIARGPVFAAVVALAVLTFAAGVVLPVVRLGSGDGSPQSIIEILLALKARHAAVPGIALAMLAAVLPGLRLLHLLTVAAAPKAARITEVLGRHATADTMVLSLTLFYLVATRAIDPVLQPGVYSLVASAALTLVACAWANMPAAVKPSTLQARLSAVQEAVKS